MKRPITLVLLISLVGCTMIPELKKPTPPIAADWSEQDLQLSSEGSQAAAILSWQDFFGSGELAEVLATALENNRDLRVASLNVEAAQALYRVQRASQLPSVDVGARASHQHLTEAQNETETTVSDYSANLATTGFELDLFGRLRSQSAAALERYFATAAARDAVQVSLLAETANAYLQWLADQQILALTEATQKAQEDAYQLLAKRQEVGLSSKLDLAQVRIAVEAAKANRALYARLVAQDVNALRLLMGVPGGSPLEVRPLEQVQLREQLPPGLPSEVLLLRPDVRQAEHELKARNADIGAARAALFPRISLTGSAGLASSELSDLFSSSALGAWSFVPQITVPIFQAGRLKANVRYSELQSDIAVARYERAIQGAFREVADALAARQTLVQEREAQQAQAAAAQEAYDLSFARYKSGIDSFLSVLDAQRTLYAAQQRVIEIDKRRLANFVTLYKALGGGSSERERSPLASQQTE